MKMIPNFADERKRKPDRLDPIQFGDSNKRIWSININSIYVFKKY